MKGIFLFLDSVEVLFDKELVIRNNQTYKMWLLLRNYPTNIIKDIIEYALFRYFYHQLYTALWKQTAVAA